ncbi:MAG TPA: hypothetical protein IAB56_07120 [Candidatus Scybalousia intestinigallinarum]|nr:hypothetical protein [Candidatus Scybalousia intestinigallinarum]
MNFIVKDGVTSRNTPASSKKALELAIHTLNVDGVETNVYLTRDGCPIIYFKEAIEGRPIIEQSFPALRGYNLGSKVKRHALIPLQDALDVFKHSKKKFILNLVDHKKNNRQYVEAIISLTTQYPEVNLYLKSDNEEIVLLLTKVRQHHQIGAVIDSFDSKLGHIPLDFYSLKRGNLEVHQTLQELAKGKVFMIEEVDTFQQLQEIEQQFHDYLSQIHCISTSFLR